MAPMFKPFTRYLQFQGRATRAEFWQFHLLYFLVATVGVVVGRMLDFTTGDASSGIGIAVYALIWLVFMPPIIAVTVRRLHDCDRSGWWLFLAFVPFGILVLIALFYVREGARGPNRFGPDEKAQPVDTVFS
jgi:uncharacterized membrane protein YhaH (DUF805 family)